MGKDRFKKQSRESYQINHVLATFRKENTFKYGPIITCAKKIGSTTHGISSTKVIAPVMW
jgi:hypothetical protein